MGTELAESEKMDVIVTAVIDPADEETDREGGSRAIPWQQEMHALRAQKYGKVRNASNSTARFASYNELKYTLRSIEAHLGPIVRDIILVTNNGAIPSWLNPRSEGIRIISHRDLLPKANYNSNAIESQLCKIPNLSNIWLYLNDDLMLLNSMKRHDFVSKQGQLVWFAESNWFLRLFSTNRFLFKILLLFQRWGLTWIDDTHVARQITAKLTHADPYSRSNGHCPMAFTQSMLSQFNSHYAEPIETLIQHEPFRTKTNFCYCYAVLKHFEQSGRIKLAKGRTTSIIGVTDYRWLNWVQIQLHWFWQWVGQSTISQMVGWKGYDFVAFQDVRTRVDPLVVNVMLDAMETMFPVPSRFEKDS